MGASSTTSTPTTFFSVKTRRRSCMVGYHAGPPGSGVPVAGISDGSKQSTSKAMKTVAPSAARARGAEPRGGVPRRAARLGGPGGRHQRRVEVVHVEGDEHRVAQRRHGAVDPG